MFAAVFTPCAAKHACNYVSCTCQTDHNQPVFMLPPIHHLAGNVAADGSSSEPSQPPHIPDDPAEALQV